MGEKKRRVRSELTAILNGSLERALLSAEALRPDGRKNHLASEPPDRPDKKSGNNARNDSNHGFLLFISLKSLHQQSARNASVPSDVIRLVALESKNILCRSRNLAVCPGPAYQPIRVRPRQSTSSHPELHSI